MPLIDKQMTMAPAGWKTLSQLIEESESKPSRSTALRVLRKAVKDGRVVVKVFAVFNGRRWCHKPHYKEKKKK